VRRVEHPDELAGLFGVDRETHIYGLADLEEPFWSHSTWYRDGPAVVGLVGAGDDWVTGYAMSRAAPNATLNLLARVQTELPPGSWVTGPIGMHEAISEARHNRPIGEHWRMILSESVEMGGSSVAVRLSMGDLDAVQDLHSSDPDRSFFLPMMLEKYPFVGIWEDGRLVASAGTHVASRRHGVAAVGAVITRPSHRGRGLGRLATSALCRILAEEYETVGLNVETTNEPAVRVYDRLGFRGAFQYEEIELL
jgi:ribosomal protein S18 acetylase RimI-like enzyme